VILAADIGRATAHVALFDQSGSRVLRVESFRTGEHERVAALVARFLDTVPGARIASACIGVGVPERVYAHELAEVFEIPAVTVVDGLEAHVYRLRDLACIAAERLVPTSQQKAAA
jgi:predicted NBD/HSP70 family sugar kinase